MQRHARLMRARCLGLALVPLAVACGVELGEPADGATNGKQDDPGGNPPAMTATMFLAVIGEQFCDECFRCRNTYPAGPAAFANDFGATVGQCYAGVAAVYDAPAVEQGISAGRILYNAAAARACAEGLAYEQSCARFWPVTPRQPAACSGALVGLIRDGGACASDFDCASLTSGCDDITKRCVPGV